MYDGFQCPKPDNHSFFVKCLWTGFWGLTARRRKHFEFSSSPRGSAQFWGLLNLWSHRKCAVLTRSKHSHRSNLTSFKCWPLRTRGTFPLLPLLALMMKLYSSNFSFNWPLYVITITSYFRDLYWGQLFKYRISTAFTTHLGKIWRITLIRAQLQPS